MNNEDEKRAALAKLALPKVKVPRWVMDAAVFIITNAEHLFPGKEQAERKKAYAKAALKAYLRERDIKEIPDWIEHPAEDFIAEVIIEGAFMLSPFSRKAEQAA